MSVEVSNEKQSAVGIRRRWRLGRQAAVAQSTVSPPVTGSILVVQDGDHASAGLLGEVLAARGLEPNTARLDQGESLPDPAGWRHVVVLGGDTTSVDRERQLSEWIARADAAGTAVFAIGSGAHALARALGGDSLPAARSRRGWITVASDNPRLVSSGPWFTWNDRALQLPPQAEQLAHDHVGPQAFRVGAHLGVDFHPEVTPELVASWASRSSETLDSQGLAEATVRDLPTALPAARQLFGAFFDAAIAA